MTKSHNLLGAHMSISGGVEKALYRGAEIGCNTVQIFTGSNRQWSSKEFSQDEINAFMNAQKETGINSVISHASYLINLGSRSHDIVQKSVQALEKELFRCAQLGIKYLVLHPGSGEPYESCIAQIESKLREIIEKSNMPVMILIENTAGQGSVVGYSLEQLAELFKSLKNTKKIGICFDTCHAWSAGYDFSHREGYEKLWQEFDQLIGIEYVKAIHMNDSLKPLGSRIDRHENIGAGTIGLEAFKLFVNDKNFKAIPKIFETPKGDDELRNDKNNLDILKKLVTAN